MALLCRYQWCLSKMSGPVLWRCLIQKITRKVPLKTRWLKPSARAPLSRTLNFSNLAGWPFLKVPTHLKLSDWLFLHPLLGLKQDRATLVLSGGELVLLSDFYDWFFSAYGSSLQIIKTHQLRELKQIVRKLSNTWYPHHHDGLFSSVRSSLIQCRKRFCCSGKGMTKCCGTFTRRQQFTPCCWSWRRFACIALRRISRFERRAKCLILNRIIFILFPQDILVFNFLSHNQRLFCQRIQLEDSVEPSTFEMTEWVQVIKRKLSG